MFLGLPSFFSFLEGLTYVSTIQVTCEILEATRATFLELLWSSVDTPGSGHPWIELDIIDNGLWFKEVGDGNDRKSVVMGR